MADAVGSSGTFLISLYMVLELAAFFVIYKFILTGGTVLLENSKSKPVFKFLSAVLAANFFFKLVLMYAGTVLFTHELLFETVSPAEITLTLIIPVVYVACKGIRVISRTAEFLIWLIIAVLAVNLVFLKVFPDFSSNLPLLNGSFGDLVKAGDKFFFWFGDLTPLMFVKLKSSKRNYVKLSVFSSWVIVIFGIVLMYAFYGKAAPYVSNVIVKVASFNQFAAKLGRLDWTGMIVWLLMSLIFLSVYFWGFVQAATQVLKSRKLVWIIGVGGLLAAEIFVKDATQIVQFALTKITWLAITANYIIPLLFLIMATIEKKREAKALSDAPVTEVVNEQGA